MTCLPCDDELTLSYTGISYPLSRSTAQLTYAGMLIWNIK